MLTATAVVLSFFLLTEVAFTCLATARKLLLLPDLPLDWKVALYVLLVLGTIGDFIFNVFRGTWIYGELPRELLFSDRVQRHVDSGDWGHDTRKWVKILNTGDPEHIYVPEGFPT